MECRLHGILRLRSGAQSSYNLYSMYSKNSLSSYAVRFNYTFNNKYLITASTCWHVPQFWQKEKNGKFPFVGFGVESGSKILFLKDSKTVSDLKLRASIGYTGNNNVAPYNPTIVGPHSFYANGTNLV